MVGTAPYVTCNCRKGVYAATGLHRLCTTGYVCIPVHYICVWVLLLRNCTSTAIGKVYNIYCRRALIVCFIP